MWLPCVCITPFGGPVVPDVYTIVARSVELVDATRSASLLWCVVAVSRPSARGVGDLAPRERLPVGAVLDLLCRGVSAPLHTGPEHPRKRIDCDRGRRWKA